MNRPARALRPISRRGLIAGGMLAGVLAAGGVPLQAQVRRGTLRLGLSGGRAMDSWNPAAPQGTFDRVVRQGAVYDCLTEVSATGELLGELAESWEAGPDARVWTITLRKGVTFHDGTALAPEDVIASFAIHRQPTSPAHGIIAQIEEMRAVGPAQIRFTLQGGNADFPFLLADPHLIIAPAERGFDGTGTGLYRLDRIEPGQRVLLSRVEAHYKDGRAGWFDRIDAQVIESQSARIAALTLGRVDAINAIAPAHRALVEAEAGLALTEVQGNARLIAELPGADDDMARALKTALDRQDLIDRRLGGRGVPAEDHPLGASNQYLLPPSAPLADPDRARWLAGRIGPDWPAQLRLRLSAGRMTEDWAFACATAPAGAWAGLGEDSAFRALLLEARASFDSALRAGIYAHLQSDCAERGRVAVVAHVPFVDGHSRQLAHGGTLGATLPLDDCRIAERWHFG